MTETSFFRTGRQAGRRAPGNGQIRIALVVESTSARGGTQTYLGSLHEEINRGGLLSTVISREHYADSQRFLAGVSSADADIICLFSVFEPELFSALASLGPTVVWVHDYTAVCPGYAKFLWRSSKSCRIGSGWRCIPKIYRERCADALAPHSVARVVRRSRRQKRTLGRVRKIIVASRFMRDVLLGNGLDPNLIEVLPIYPVCPIQSKSPEDDSGFILFAGRLEKEKGLPQLLSAMSKTDPSLQLEIAGEGTERLSYERMVEELNLKDRTRFLGWLDQPGMDRKMRECRFFVMPSIWPEPYGIVGIESLARGKPVIAFDVGGIKEWLKDGTRGFLVEPLHIEGLARRMESLWSNPSRARLMGERGREFVEKNLTKELHMARISRVFHDLVPGQASQ